MARNIHDYMERITRAFQTAVPQLRKNLTGLPIALRQILYKMGTTLMVFLSILTGGAAWHQTRKDQTEELSKALKIPDPLIELALIKKGFFKLEKLKDKNRILKLIPRENLEKSRYLKNLNPMLIVRVIDDQTIEYWGLSTNLPTQLPSTLPWKTFDRTVQSDLLFYEDIQSVTSLNLPQKIWTRTKQLIF